MSGAMIALKGVAASPGIAIGPIFPYHPIDVAINRQNVPAELRAGEWDAFLAGRARAAAALEKLIAQTRADKSEDYSEIFEGHLEILLDDAIADEIRQRVFEDGQSALAAISDCLAAQRDEFLALEDPYLRARADDVADIARRLLSAAAGLESPDLSLAPKGAIILAHDLGPSDVAQLVPGSIAGMICECGGPTCHVAIMARTQNLPAVVGCGPIMHLAAIGEQAALDGDCGEVVLRPDAAALAGFEARRRAHLRLAADLDGLADLPAQTQDGRRVVLAANIGSPADADAAMRWNPDGIGLMRTEFLFMARGEASTEEEQFQAYVHVVRTMADRPVIIRTMDVGGDKPVAGFKFPREANPFLGWRGARLFIYGADGAIPNREPIMYGHCMAQLCAILRAAAEGEIWLMWPMIATPEEIKTLSALLEDARALLTRRGQAFGALKTGVMIETPAAALMADVLAAHVDFFSIGSNDLTQYALAVDRGSEHLGALYQTFHPAIWRLIAQTIAAGHRFGKPVGLCGELAGVEAAALPLLGLGLDEFSMAGSSLPRIKRIIRATSMTRAERVAQKVLNCATAAEAESVANQALQDLKTAQPELF